MDIVSSFILTLKAGLDLWLSKEKTKYQDELIRIETAYYHEKRKPDPNMALLDDLEHQLFVLGSSFASASARGSSSQVPS